MAKTSPVFEALVRLTPNVKAVWGHRHPEAAEADHREGRPGGAGGSLVPRGAVSLGRSRPTDG